MDHSNRSTLSRRSFLAGGTLAAGAVALGSLVGCEGTPQSASDKNRDSADRAEAQGVTDWLGVEPQIEEANISRTIDTEVLVVGGGTSGLFAAAAAAEAGAKTLVMERFETGGGVRVGFAAVGSRLQAENGIELDKNKVIQELVRYSNGQGDARLYKLWADTSGEAVDWWEERCRERGITVWVEPGGQHPEENYWYMQTCHSPQYTEDDFKGANILTDYCTENGAEFLYNTAMVKLEKQGTRVTGVVAENKADGYVRVNASKGVIICTGGYGSNPEMLEALQPQSLRKVAFSACVPGTNGDGIKACLWAGAALDDIHTMMVFDRAALLPSETKQADTIGKMFWMGSHPFLKVNIHGERFASESVPYDHILHAAMSQPGNTYCTIWDSNFVEDMVRFDMQGCARLVPFENGAPPVMPLQVIQGMNAGLLEEGYIQQADTIEELAKKLEIPVDTFAATVARYNELFDAQNDEDFGKEAYRLSQLRTPPFYGVRQSGHSLCTLDGIKINTDMNAVNDLGEPIEGLYVAGNDSGGYYAGTYPTHSGGNACGRSCTFARLAGKHAARA